MHFNVLIWLYPGSIYVAVSRKQKMERISYNSRFIFVIFQIQKEKLMSEPISIDLLALAQTHENSTRRKNVHRGDNLLTAFQTVVYN